MVCKVVHNYGKLTLLFNHIFIVLGIHNFLKVPEDDVCVGSTTLYV